MNVLRKATIAILIVAGICSCSKETLSPLSPGSEESVTNAIGVTAIHHLGEAYGGGYIFYLDSTKQHGLIAAPVNQSPKDNITWCDGKYVITKATDTAYGSGLANTQKIVTRLGTTGNYAALLCVNYRAGGYTDWFLPSKDELFKMSHAQKYVPEITGGNYWSSTETDFQKAWIVHFHRSLVGSVNKGGFYHVRAMRAF